MDIVPGFVSVAESVLGHDVQHEGMLGNPRHQETRTLEEDDGHVVKVVVEA